MVYIDYVSFSHDIQGYEIKPPNKIDLFLEMIVYNPKLILISIWIKRTTEIQHQIIKSFYHQFDSNC